MDAISLDSSSRLLEAFERMSIPQGEGLVSSGPSPVPDALSRAFEQLLEQSDARPASAGTAGQPEVQNVSPSARDATSKDSVAENVSADRSAVTGASEAPLLSPSELYHLQFQVAMLRFQADSGYQVTQKTTQGLDSMLRNQS